MNIEPDPTESIRRYRLVVVNGAIESQDNGSERQRLEAQYGQVWVTAQLAVDFEILGFMAPYVVVRRKSDKRKGGLEFQHHPRLYFNFVLDADPILIKVKTTIFGERRFSAIPVLRPMPTVCWLT